ncbi:phosphatase PAP2 family protein [Streptomyces lushanensis]|uniref:phosphatase PAP2 family protein n=1 Tax=Streptomyces lushanensis TaxID=1434255 RepID=UPI00082F7425|nr:phosphatase PAP2 family protein [Streptomyces lushanensis]
MTAADTRAVAMRPLGVAALLAAVLTALALVVAGRNGAPFALDRDALDWSVAHRPAGPVAVARGVTATGTGVLPYLCAVAAGLLMGRGIRGRLVAAVGATAFLLAAQAVRYGVLYGVHRPRPPVADWATHASRYAFPSGHATTSALVAGLLVWAVLHRGGAATRGEGREGGGPRSRRFPAYTLCALIVCWAVAVGLTRIYLGVHWVTDVLGGWLYAGTWLGLGAALFPLARTLPRDRRGGGDRSDNGGEGSQERQDR